MAGFLATVDFSNPYFAVLVLLVIALAMSVGFVLLSQALGPKRYDRIKYGVYECGVDPVTPASVRVSVKFYLLAILFILFDRVDLVTAALRTITNNRIGIASLGLLFEGGPILVRVPAVVTLPHGRSLLVSAPKAFSPQGAMRVNAPPGPVPAFSTPLSPGRCRIPCVLLNL